MANISARDVGEIIAVTCLVLSLIFVGLELRQSTIASRAAAFQEFDEAAQGKMHGITFEKYFSSQLVTILVSEVEHFFARAVSAALRLHPNKKSHSQWLDRISS